MVLCTFKWFNGDKNFKFNLKSNKVTKAAAATAPTTAYEIHSKTEWTWSQIALAFLFVVICSQKRVTKHFNAKEGFNYQYFRSSGKRHELILSHMSHIRHLSYAIFTCAICNTQYMYGVSWLLASSLSHSPFFSLFCFAMNTKFNSCFLVPFSHYLRTRSTISAWHSYDFIELSVGIFFQSKSSW